MQHSRVEIDIHRSFTLSRSLARNSAKSQRNFAGVTGPCQAQRCRQRLSRECRQHSSLSPSNPTYKWRTQNPRGPVTVASATSDSKKPSAAVTEIDPGIPAKRNLLTAAGATRKLGWASFWTQLSLSIISCILYVFSVAFTPTAGGHAASLYLTLFGIIAGLISTFWTFGYVRLSRKLRGYMEAGPGADIPRISKVDVLATLQRGSWINVVGLGATIIGLQATVGMLVAKTLTNATANPFLSGGNGSYNPVLALDVFLIQASTNTLLAHFASLVFTLILSRIVSRGAGQPSGQVVPATS